MSSFDQNKPSRRTFLLSSLLAGAGLAFGGPLHATRGGPPRQALRIGIIGSGNMGGGLGRLWAAAGHRILFSSRHPEELADLVAAVGETASAGTPAQAAEFGEVVLIAVPYGALPQIGRDQGPLMRGKIVIDCGNPREDRDGPMANDALDRGTGVASAEYLPGVRLVRAFNAIAYTMLERNRTPEGDRIGVPIAGDDPEALRIVADLVQDAGLDPVIVGPLARAREFDRGTPVYVRGLTAAQIREALNLPDPSQ